MIDDRILKLASTISRCGYADLLHKDKPCDRTVAFVVSPNCSCWWHVNACTGHLAAIVRLAGRRDDCHYSKDRVTVRPA